MRTVTKYVFWPWVHLIIVLGVLRGYTYAVMKNSNDDDYDEK